MKLIFELTNEQRKYLGLIPVEEHWELVKFDNGIYYYFEDDIIRKEIKVSKNYYHEAELNEKTAENRTMILPKTKREKLKNLIIQQLNLFHLLELILLFQLME
ncbi:hypothetical protein VYE96_10430 [Fusobacterium pseudoperiodonticum]|nr:hypothetical protein [Fusobacterium pseudoperiodonticum]